MVFEKVREIIVEQLNVDESDVTMDTHLMKDLEADSLDAVELVMKLEEGLDIQLDLDRELQTIDDLVKFVEEKSAE